MLYEIFSYSSDDAHIIATNHPLIYTESDNKVNLILEVYLVAKSSTTVILNHTSPPSNSSKISVILYVSLI